MSDLTTWLLRVFEEDEATARAMDLTTRGFEGGTGSWFVSDTNIGDKTGYVVAYHVMWDAARKHIALHDPASVCADIAAKRAILALHQPDRPADTWYWLERECAGCGSRWHAVTPPGTPPTVIGPERGCPTIRLLASAYANRPGYPITN